MEKGAGSGEGSRVCPCSLSIEKGESTADRGQGGHGLARLGKLGGVWVGRVGGRSGRGLESAGPSWGLGVEWMDLLGDMEWNGWGDGDLVCGLVYYEGLALGVEVAAPPQRCPGNPSLGISASSHAWG